MNQMKITKGLQIESKSSPVNFSDATGSNDEDVGMRMLALCASASGIIKAEVDTVKSIKTTRSLLADLAPQDAMEGLIVSRLVSIHEQCMQFLATSSSAMNDQVRDLYVNMATKLARLFNETLDMLLRYRRKGEQRVIVQHVNVNDGGKAIVGNMLSS